MLLVKGGCAAPSGRGAGSPGQRVTTLQPPGRDMYARLDPEGISVLPSGRWVKPAGESVSIEHDPFGLALSPDGQTILTVHDEVLTVIPASDLQSAARYPSLDKKTPGPFANGSFMGAAVAGDSQTAYLSGGNGGDVILFDLKARRRTGSISLNAEVGGKKYADSFTGDLALSPDSKRLYALDQFNFRMVEIDTAAGKIVRSIPTGRFPFGLGLLPDGRKAYVANVGIFDYPLVPGVDLKKVKETGLKFPAYGFPSREAEEGVEVEGRRIPGLGSPHVPEAVSVWAIDLEGWKVTARLKTGYRMGDRVEGLEVVGGASPNSIACGRRRVFVTNATNDNISVIDPRSDAIEGTVRLTIDPRLDRWRGLIPFGLALSPDESRLYVALSGLNAVAVVDADSLAVLGAIPTGWFPTKLAVSPDNRWIAIATSRGFGAGPNGGLRFQVPPQGTYVGDIMLGTVHRLEAPDGVQLERYTREVVLNTVREIAVEDDGRNPLPAAPGLRRSPIRHIVYITKENRTYDQVFGQILEGRGDPSLARYGAGSTVCNKNRTRCESGVTVMPNHLKIARDFAVSDNFYCDSDASVHGHRWMVGTYPNEWVEANAATKKDCNIHSTAPGRKFVSGSSGAVYPEDYNEAGGMWEHLARHGIDFYNFGLGFEFSAADEEAEFADTGVRMHVSFPLPKPLFDRTSRIYATYNTSVPDQYRIDMFEKELEERWLSGRHPFPPVITMMIPNDHGADERPEAGYPFRESYMADNDLAVGRVLHRLSRTPWWKEMLVIITEDDPQDGRDSVDAHRSILLLAGPWVKRGHVSHTHANFGSILKTIYLLLDLPPLNQFDAAASLLQDFFTDQSDFTPYTAGPVDPRIFDPQKALKPYDRAFNPEWLKLSPQIDNEADFRKSHNN
ncbi:MAG: phosphoesterase [Planctomycetes bacterium]|nr:phosphoesterase [Planctomycetota bacterium]